MPSPTTTINYFREDSVTRFFRNLNCACLLFVCVAMATAPASAQTAGGSLTVVVNGAAPPDVIAKDQSTGFTWHGLMGATGVYIFPDLPTGTYTITAGTGTVTGVHVEAATRFLVNVSTGTEERGSTIIEPVTSDLGTFVQPKFFLDAPLFVNGTYRDPQQFLAYLPGVAEIQSGARGNPEAPFQSTNPSTGVVLNAVTGIPVGSGPHGFSIAGGPVGSVEVLIGGLSIVNPQTGVAPIAPTVEEVTEFSLLTGNLPAEYGRTGGGVEVYIERHGTNALHGKVFDYVRNAALDANGWAVNSFPAIPQTKLEQNEYGVTISGPVILPEVYDGRNKSFASFSFNQLKHNSFNTLGYVTVPTNSERAGNFTNLRNAQGQQIPIYDPSTLQNQGTGLTRTVYTDNIITASELSPVAARIAAYIPTPNNAQSTLNYLGQNLVDDTQYNWSFRADQILNKRQRVSAFIDRQKHDSLDEGPLPGAVSNGNVNYFVPQIYQVNWDFARNAQQFNRLSFGYTTYYTHWDRIPDQDQNFSQLLGLTGVDSGGASSFPVIEFTSGPYAPLGRYTDFRTVGGEFDSTIQISDTMTVTRGKHEFKAGIDFRRGRSFQKPLQQTGTQGIFTFSNVETALPSALATTGDSFASFLLGDADSGVRYVTTTAPDLHYLYGALFVQDNFKFSPKLTLNVGLRYDVPTAGYDTNGLETSFSPTLPNPAAGNIPGALSYAGKSNGHNGEKRFGNVDYKEVAPRVGVAYAYDSKTVLRGGWGLMYSAGNQLSGNNCTLCFLGATTQIAQYSDGLNPALVLDQGLQPQLGYLPAPVISPSAANGTSIFFISPNSGKAPRIQNYSVNIQRQLPMGVLVDVGYLGISATRLNGDLPLNQLNPSYLSLGSLLSQSITAPAVVAKGYKVPYAGFTGTLAQALRPFPQYNDITDAFGAQFKSHYNSLQIKASKRYNDFNILFDYTWSKNTSDGSSSQAYTNILAPQNAYNLSGENGFNLYDIPQTANLIYTWDLPLGKGKRYMSSGSNMMNAILSGWTLAIEQHYRSGNLLLVTVPNALGAGVLYSDRTRANVTGQPFRTSTSANSLDPNNPTSLYLNPAAFSIAPAYTFGNAANFYNNVRNPPILQENFSVVKRTPVRETVNVEYRLDVYNILNRQLFGNIDTNLTDPNFGRPTGVMIQPRLLQMGLKLNF